MSYCEVKTEFKLTWTDADGETWSEQYGVREDAEHARDYERGMGAIGVELLCRAVAVTEWEPVR